MTGKMIIPKGYKQSEVGVIPEEWEVKRLGELASLKNGYAFKSDTYTPLGNFKVITIANVQDGYMTTNECNSIACVPKDLQNHQRLQISDILISMTGNVGRVCRVTENFCLLNQRVGKLIPTTVDGSTLFMLLRQPSFIKAMTGVAKGGAQPNLSVSDISNHLFCIPKTKSEQSAIAEALSDADALIESLEQLIAKKRRIKQGAMQELLTGKKRLSGFSEKWDIQTFGDLFSFSGGYSASRDQLSSNGYCYLHYGDIHGASKPFVDTATDYQEIPKLDIPLNRVSRDSLLDDGDVVFVDASEDDAGTSKHIVVVNKNKVPFISGLHTIIAKSKTNELAHEYRRYCFQAASIQKQFLHYAAGTKVTGISKKNIVKILLKFPELNEQIAIAEVLSDIDVEIAALETKFAKARQIKQGMMQELLTGRIRLV
ncbi:MAG TPA: restriction endonuclease subunit S [Candidatus Ozemobacteraceae bacterium]|nr:restriction endonuclease subunit S [Candidatus Ozemobacteraceae bacterium]